MRTERDEGAAEGEWASSAPVKEREAQLDEPDVLWVMSQRRKERHRAEGACLRRAVQAQQKRSRHD